MRIITITAGVIMMLTGVWSFASSGTSFLSLAFIFGNVMIIAGLTGAINYFSEKERNLEGSCVVAESILTFILGCIVVSNHLLQDAIIVIFFGMWLIFSGCLRVVASFQLRSLQDKNWWWTLGFGILASLAGLYAFINSNTFGISVITIIGVFFLIQGANVLVVGINMPHKKKYFLHKNQEKNKDIKDINEKEYL